MKHVNCKKIIAELNDAGYSNPKIAEKAGLPHKTVWSVLKGKQDPQQGTINKILNVYRELLGLEAEEMDPGIINQIIEDSKEKSKTIKKLEKRLEECEIELKILKEQPQPQKKVAK